MFLLSLSLIHPFYAQEFFFFYCKIYNQNILKFYFEVMRFLSFTHMYIMRFYIMM